MLNSDIIIILLGTIIMANWKVVVNINNNKEQKTIFVKDVKTETEVYSVVKKYFILERPEIDFCRVESVTLI